jgi:hypothetical protein
MKLLLLYEKNILFFNDHLLSFDYQIRSLMKFVERFQFYYKKVDIFCMICFYIFVHKTTTITLKEKSEYLQTCKDHYNPIEFTEDKKRRSYLHRRILDK